MGDLNDVALDPVSEENSVTDVLGKVSAGQADAGIVYVTDIARGGGKVEQVELDGADQVINKYPAAAVRASENQDQADDFVKFLGSDTAQKLLRDAGFAAG
ncbi:extracellular solute-binding protein [Brevibacterium linens]|uniref:extracellular solute-binding protein n=1 Tax=Brevibacterium linens TaxID=1703 RepID=UPI001F49A50E|nr:extracellular solute-binding protein [Brevibacterium linens]